MTKKYEKKNLCHNVHVNFTKVPNELIRSKSLNPTEKTIGIVLLSYNPSFPSYDKIMKDANIGSRTTISKTLKKLKEYEFFEVIQDSQYKSNLYRYIDSRVDSPSTEDELETVYELDTNKTNSIILNNHINGSPAPPKGADEPILNKEEKFDFEDAYKSLGSAAKLGFTEKTRPTFIVEDMNK